MGVFLSIIESRKTYWANLTETLYNAGWYRPTKESHNETLALVACNLLVLYFDNEIGSRIYIGPLLFQLLSPFQDGGRLFSQHYRTLIDEVFLVSIILNMEVFPKDFSNQLKMDDYTILCS